MKYSNLPVEFSFICRLMDNQDHPTGYGWIGITGEKDNPICYLQGWLCAEDEVISCIENKKWFQEEIRSLLDEKFTPNTSLEYLVKFVWDRGDPSVGIFPGYNCELVIGEYGYFVTRTYENQY